MFWSSPELILAAAFFEKFIYLLSSGGAGKLTVDKLEESISQIKEMFRERMTLMDKMAATPAGASENTEEDYYY